MTQLYLFFNCIFKALLSFFDFIMEIIDTIFLNEQVDVLKSDLIIQNSLYESLLIIES